MVLFAISGVFSGFNNITGHIYFALLPVQEGTAALHILYLTVIMPHTWQLLVQSEKEIQSRNTGGTRTRWFQQHIHIQNAIQYWNAQLHCPVALNFLDEYTDVYVYILYHLKILCNVWKKIE